MATKTIGWDIGGAHVKTVLVDNQGNVMSALQVACPLWQGLDKLATAVRIVLKRLAIKPEGVTHAVTMTGELADIFPNRLAGVTAIANTLVTLLGKHIYFYSVQSFQESDHFISIDKMPMNSAQIASANWHASARYIAQKVGAGLMIDIGSTTTDIIPLVEHAVVDVGLTDANRMQQDSLVYTGVVRTPVMALTHKVTLDVVEINVAAEHFATIADVYRLTGELIEDKDMLETADGKSKTKLDAARRLARMVGYDVEDKGMDSWVQLAYAFRAIQIKQIKTAVIKHLDPTMSIVGAGTGAFLAKLIAKELKCRYMDVAEMIDSDTCQDVSMCLPAYAVAYFASRQKAVQC